jgi:hypothetical protein
MKKSILLMGILLMGSALCADTYYLQTDMTTGKGSAVLLTNELWFSQPSGGGEHPAKISGNSFVINGHVWRTPNTSKTSRFPGTIVVGAAGANTGELMSAVWQPTHLQIEAEALMRLRQPVVTLQPETLSINGKGTAIFRAHSDGSLSLTLEAGKLEGDGRLVFGKYQATDRGGVWSFSVQNSVEFTGTIAVDYGMLLIEDSLSLATATMEINAKNGAVLVLDEAKLVVGQLQVNGLALAAGDYAASELGVQLADEVGSICVKGSGNITVLK